MVQINKKILTDESMNPIAVQIDYADWLEIERILAQRNGAAAGNPPTDINRFKGTIPLKEDPAEYQRRVRGECD